MNILKPEYYDEFKCIGDECKDNCCKGWDISLDKKSYLKYKKIRGEFGSFLNSNIHRDRKNNSEFSYGKVTLKDNTCPLLNESGLCNIYIKLGKDSMSNVCKMYPRTIVKYDAIYEKNLSISCPSVAKKLISIKTPISFKLTDENLSNIEPSYTSTFTKKNSLYQLLWEGRNFCIDIAQFREIDLWKRLVLIKFTTDKLCNLIENRESSEVTNTIDILKESITSLETIQSLDKIEDYYEVKLKLIYSIIENRASHGIKNEKFIEILDTFNKFITSVPSDDILNYYTKKEIEFNAYLKSYENILENYIVYNLYTNYMNAIKDENLSREVINLIISYSIIKMLLLAKWDANSKTLSDNDIVDVLSSFSKVVEHSSSYLDRLYNTLKHEGFDHIAYMSILSK